MVRATAGDTGWNGVNQWPDRTSAPAGSTIRSRRRAASLRGHFSVPPHLLDFSPEHMLGHIYTLYWLTLRSIISTAINQRRCSDNLVQPAYVQILS